ncbi:MAG: hypothetical protein JHD35_24945 [Sphingopyxis sp.]|nr:hypothetical protein [Sphingopyxis sp.]
MSVYAESLAAIAADSEIATLFSATSLGDRSVAFQLLETENSAGMTSEGSPNHRLWRCFERHGWMTVSEYDAGEDMPMRMYEGQLTERGRRCLPVIYDQLAS